MRAMEHSHVVSLPAVVVVVGAAQVRPVILPFAPDVCETVAFGVPQPVGYIYIYVIVRVIVLVIIDIVNGFQARQVRVRQRPIAGFRTQHVDAVGLSGFHHEPEPVFVMLGVDLGAHRAADLKDGGGQQATAAHFVNAVGGLDGLFRDGETVLPGPSVSR